MSDNNASAGAEAAPGGKKKIVPLLIILLVGVVLGGGVGAFVMAPMLSGEAHAQKASDGEHADEENADEEHAEESASEKSGSRSARKAAPGVLYTFDNLVLNPAGTGGTRFLMVSAAFELKDTKASDDMKARDLEVRDVMVGVLGARTVDELADITQRETIKEDLRKQVDALFPRGSVRRVYLPQFVIQ